MMFLMLLKLSLLSVLLQITHSNTHTSYEYQNDLEKAAVCVCAYVRDVQQ